jgi:hypothetical protein
MPSSGGTWRGWPGGSNYRLRSTFREWPGWAEDKFGECLERMARKDKGQVGEYL